MCRTRVNLLFSLPNSLSFLRILLTPLFLFLTFQGQKQMALLVFSVAAFTDWADGYCARRFHQTSTLGQRLDPLADKILLVGSYVGFYFLGFIPLWLLIIVVSRDVLIVLMAIVLLIQKASFDMKPHEMSKANTGCQIAHIALILLPVPVEILVVSEYLVAITTLLSGVDYGVSLLLWCKKKSVKIT